jgi:hypothetical protein
MNFFMAICSDVWRNALLLCSDANSIIIEVIPMPPMALCSVVEVRTNKEPLRGHRSSL